MWSKIRLAIYGTTALAGIIWPFYFINQFINLVRNGNIQGSAIDIGNAFFDDAWITPTSGFISADTAVLLIAIFVFYAAEGRRLKLRLWGIYFPLTFIISLAFSFGAFMFIRELKTNKELNEIYRRLKKDYGKVPIKEVTKNLDLLIGKKDEKGLVNHLVLTKKIN